MKKVGVFTHVLIKKRQYWPKCVPGEQIIQHFTNKSIGSSDAIKGELDGVSFHIYGLKEPDYVMLIMSMYGTMSELGEDRKRHVMVNGVQQVHTFKYPEVVHNHYRYRDTINNHNSLQMHPLSMEETWMTACWPHHVFCF